VAIDVRGGGGEGQEQNGDAPVGGQDATVEPEAPIKVEGNELFDDYMRFATQAGAETDPAKLGIDPKNLTQQQMDLLLERHYVESFAKRTGNDALIRAHESGLDFESYTEEYKIIKEDLAAPDDALLKGSYFLEAQDAHAKMGMSVADIAALYKGDDAATLNEEQKASAYLSSIAVKKFAKLSAEQQAVEAGKIRQGLEADLEALGSRGKQVEAKKQEEQMKVYMQQVEDLTKTYKDKLSKKSSIGIIPLDGEADKAELVEYARQQFTPTEIETIVDGKKVKSTVIPFYHTIQNDPDAVLEYLNYERLRKAGRLTDFKNGIRAQAMKDLGVHPYIKREKDTSGGDGLKYVDNSRGPGGGG